MSPIFAQLPDWLRNLDPEERDDLINRFVSDAITAANGYWDLGEQKRQGVPPKERTPFRNTEAATDALYNQVLILLSIIPALGHGLPIELTRRLNELQHRHDAGISR